MFAVNSAIEKIAADWWVVGDPEPLALYTPCEPVKGGLAVDDGTVHRIRANPSRFGRAPEVIAKNRLIPWSEIAIDPPTRWRTFTMTAAIVLAAHRGHRDITLFGCDLRGELDYAGRGSGRAEAGTRSEARWQLEAEILRETSLWLWKHGIAVSRKQPSANEKSTPLSTDPGPATAPQITDSAGSTSPRRPGG